MKYEQGSKAGNTVIYFCNQGFECKKFPDLSITTPADSVFLSFYLKKKKIEALPNKAVYKWSICHTIIASIFFVSSVLAYVTHVNNMTDFTLSPPGSVAINLSVSYPAQDKMLFFLSVVSFDYNCSGAWPYSIHN